MNAVLKYVTLVVLCVLLWGCGPSIQQVATAQDLDCTRPNVDCRVAIATDTSDDAIPPSVGHQNVRVEPDQQVAWSSNTRTLVVFPDGTPFVDGKGNPIYTFYTGSQEISLKVRNFATDHCPVPRGCPFKYYVIDTENSRRPPLHPYIIILR